MGPRKGREQYYKTGIAFDVALRVFEDPRGLIQIDQTHSGTEQRWRYIGKIENQITTVVFTSRKGYLRIISAGFWRKGRKLYEKENPKE